MFQTFKEKYYRWSGRVRLIHRYEYLNEVNKILEEYLTSKILMGGSNEFITKGRDELAKKQSEIKETQSMIDFLKRI